VAQPTQPVEYRYPPSFRWAPALPPVLLVVVTVLVWASPHTLWGDHPDSTTQRYSQWIAPVLAVLALLSVAYRWIQPYAVSAGTDGLVLRPVLGKPRELRYRDVVGLLERRSRWARVNILEIRTARRPYVLYQTLGGYRDLRELLDDKVPVQVPRQFAR
jgi:hypothetical protein